MDVVVNSIIRFLVNNKAINQDEDEIAFYRYGIEISLSSIIGVILILLLGVFFKDIAASLIYLSMFILIRTITGGFHASTYIKCNLLTSSGFIIVLYASLLMNGYINRLFILGAYILSIAIIIYKAPVENNNKPISNNKRKVFKIISVFIYAVLFVINYNILNDKTTKDEIMLFTALLIIFLILIKKEEVKT